MTYSKILAKDIHAKRPKLDEADLTHVESHDALSALVVKGCSLDKAKADADVTAWMAGRASDPSRQAVPGGSAAGGGSHRGGFRRTSGICRKKQDIGSRSP